MDNVKGKDGSCFHNSILIVSGRDYNNPAIKNGIINGEGENVTCRLNGYAVIPIEDYYELKKNLCLMELCTEYMIWKSVCLNKPMVFPGRQLWLK